jgi:glycogen debranching enzyme
MYSADDLTDQAFERSVALLRANSVPEGFLASGEQQHYRAIWARDALFTSLGASLTGLPDVVDTARRTLLTLARLQAPLGQIPNAYWPERGYWDWGEAGSLDGAALFVIVAWQHVLATGDTATLRALWPHLDTAMTWLRAQDPTNVGLLTSPEAADWMDSSLKRSGKVLYVNVLYAWAAECYTSAAAELGRPATIDHLDIKRRINLLFWPTDPDVYARLLAHVPYPATASVHFPPPASPGAIRGAFGPRRHYLSHLTYGRVFDRCDVLGNLLAIWCGIADDGQRDAILDYLAAVTIAEPYPVRVLPGPELPDDPDSMLDLAAERYQGPAWRNPPYSYHNAGVWPFVGGFYVAALAKAGRLSAARSMLRRLAHANQAGIAGPWEFHEWLDGQTGAPRGAALQSWNAGCYVLAHQALRGVAH